LRRSSYRDVGLARHGLTEVMLRRHWRTLACYQRALLQRAPQVLFSLKETRSLEIPSCFLCALESGWHDVGQFLAIYINLI
jgi:hypothetical protein